MADSARPAKKRLSEMEVANLAGRTVLVRADFNVPLEDGRVTDDQRIRASIPTLRTLTNAGARVVLLSHLGRPKGKPNPAMSLQPVARRLGELLDTEVGFVPEPVGRRAVTTANIWWILFGLGLWGASVGHVLSQVGPGNLHIDPWLMALAAANAASGSPWPTV